MRSEMVTISFSLKVETEQTKKAVKTSDIVLGRVKLLNNKAGSIRQFLKAISPAAHKAINKVLEKTLRYEKPKTQALYRNRS